MLKKLGTAFGVGVLTVVLALPALTLTASDVEAKGFSSSRSFSRSSFRSSSFSSKKPSFKSYSSSKSKTYSTSSKTKSFSTTSSKTSSVKTSGSSKKSFTSGSRSKTASVLQAKRERTKFKKPSTLGKRVSRKEVNRKYASNPVYTRARTSDSSTYWNRRNSYYNGYSTPVYVYNTSPSFGMWDTVFLYYMLSNTSNASQFAYHHQNDADYVAWRREADRLAQDNADLRRQLTAMDTGRTSVSGPVNPGYLPKGVDADIALSQEARSATVPELRVCVGSRSGAYFNIAAGIIAPNVSEANVTIVETAGTGEILKNVSEGKCDAGFVQGDGYWNYVEDHQTTSLPFERVFSPYRETVHLICNEKGPKTIADLSNANAVYFPKGSGAAETWRNFIGEDSDYNKVKTVLNTPSMNIASNEEALLKARNSKNACMMYVGAQGATKFMRNVDATSKGSKLVLIDVDDSSLDNTEDPSGSDVYQFSDISTNKYSNLLRNGGCYGFCSGDVRTLSVGTDFIVSTKWKEKNSKVYPNLAVTLMGLQTDITRHLNYSK